MLSFEGPQIIVIPKILFALPQEPIFTPLGAISTLLRIHALDQV